MQSRQRRCVGQRPDGESRLWHERNLRDLQEASSNEGVGLPVGAERKGGRGVFGNLQCKSIIFTLVPSLRNLLSFQDVAESAKTYSADPVRLGMVALGLVTLTSLTSCSILESLITFALEFLKDKCHRLSKEQQEALWFKLLSLLMDLSVEEKEKTSGKLVTLHLGWRLQFSIADFKAIIVRMVHAMIHFVNPSQLLPKLLDVSALISGYFFADLVAFQHPLFHGGTYAEFRDLIDGIFNGYAYDEVTIPDFLFEDLLSHVSLYFQVLLSKLVSCIHGEIHDSSTRLRRLASAGYQTSADVCSICDHFLNSTSDRAAIVFE